MRKHLTKKVVLLLVIGLLASASAAYAAFGLFTNTVSGTGTGAFTSATTSTSALSLTQTSALSPSIGPGDTGTIGFTLHNNTTASHTVQTTTATFTVTGATGTAGNGDNADCAAHLSMGAENITGSSPPPGTDATGRTLNVVAAANTPIGCKSATISVAVGGTTS